MERRSFLAGILALGAAPAIVRATSLMGFAEAPRPIILPAAQDIVIATAMPTQAEARKLWPGADLAKRTDDGYDVTLDVMGFTRDAPVLCKRPDGILVMASEQAIMWSQNGPYPLSRVADDFKILDYKYPPPKRRTPRQVEAQSRFNFVLGDVPDEQLQLRGDEDAALRGEDLPHEVAMDHAAQGARARNHFARRVGELRAQLPVTAGDYPTPFDDYMVPEKV